MRVLVAEDETIIRLDLVEMLARAGLDVVGEARDGIEAVELAQRDGDVVLAVADDGAGIDGEANGTGLSIVRALVRDELHGTLSLERNGPFRAEVVFPA